MDEIIEALSCCPLFHGKKKHDIETIMARTDFYVKSFKKKNFISTVDHTSELIGIIVRGVVEVQKTLVTGNGVSLYLKNRGQMFGGAVAFSQTCSYPCDIYAKEASIILFISRQTVFDLVRDDEKLCSNLLGLFSDSVLQMENRLELFSCSSIKRKIAFYLLQPENQTESNLVCLQFSQKTWAEYMNVSRPSLCRELQALNQAGIIGVNGRMIRIIDEKRLTKILLS